MRTLEDIERDLEVAKKEAEPLIKARDEAVRKCDALYEEVKQFKMQNGLFMPMSELEKHKGKSISYIELVVRNEDGTLETKDMWGGEIFEVDKNGHLDYSDYTSGVMYYDATTKKYEHDFHYHPTMYDFIGYLEIEFEEDKD